MIFGLTEDVVIGTPLSDVSLSFVRAVPSKDVSAKRQYAFVGPSELNSVVSQFVSLPPM